MGRYLGLLGHLPSVYCLEHDTRLSPDLGDQDQAMEDVLLLLVPASNPGTGRRPCGGLPYSGLWSLEMCREALVFNI